MKPQLDAIRKNPHVIVATPGRLIDHLNQKTVHLEKVNILVLDEADRMLDMGFLPQIKRILQTVPKERQTMLFSATLPSEVMRIAASYMKIPIRIEIAPPGTTVERVSQEIFMIGKDQKIRLLEKILTEYKGSTLIFTRTKHGAKRVAKVVREMGHSASEIHSNRSLAQRRDALDGFKSGKYRVLVATDIAARGIDVVGIELVLNYDLPSQTEDYVHRIGRTARAGAEGHAISFATRDEQQEVRDIERLIRKNLPVSALPELPPARAFSEPDSRSERFQTPRSSYSRNNQPRGRSRPPGRFDSRRGGRGRQGKRRFGR
jgi:ATP-dependent RNA helicase RhlE